MIRFKLLALGLFIVVYYIVVSGFVIGSECLESGLLSLVVSDGSTRWHYHCLAIGNGSEGRCGGINNRGGAGQKSAANAGRIRLFCTLGYGKKCRVRKIRENADHI